MLETNTQAPNFILLNQDSQEVSLRDFLGQYILIYFYPKDDTPGCTKEACAIAEVYDDFKKMNITVLGISADSPEKHTKFCAKYNLPFTLLSDSGKKVIEVYGAKSALGIKRVSYLIDKTGVIIKVYPKVDPVNHALEILNDVKKLA